METTIYVSFSKRIPPPKELCIYPYMNTCIILLEKHIYLETYRYIQTYIDTYRHIQTLIDTYRHLQTHINTYRHIKTHIDTYKRCITIYLNIYSYAMIICRASKGCSTQVNHNFLASYITVNPRRSLELVLYTLSGQLSGLSKYYWYPCGLGCPKSLVKLCMHAYLLYLFRGSPS